jgi:MarR family transcriptional regulator, organic hydroperoxide resistance regulator
MATKPATTKTTETQNAASKDAPTKAAETAAAGADAIKSMATSPPYGPTSWLAGEVGRTDPGSEAWSLIHWLMVTNKQRFVVIGQEFDLAPQAAIALRMLGAGPRRMGELAQALFCDNSNITGITDRLEERGLVRREPDPSDRRVKLLVLTDEGERMRVEMTKRMAEPPPQIAALSEDDQRALRDILRRAVEQAED